MKKPLLFTIQTESPNGFLVQSVNAGNVNPIADNLQCMDTFLLNGTTYVIAFETGTGIAHIYQAYSNDGTYMVEVGQDTVSANISQIAIIGDAVNPLCLACDGSSGIITFLKITSGFKLNSLYSLNVGEAITTLKTMVYRNVWLLVAYNMETGDVNKYEVTVDSSSNSVSATKVWNAAWAKGWTRFSFFQLGAENFFIKTNMNYNKVNIDHFMDDADEGSHPVMNIIAPAQMVGLNNVNAFIDPKGFPYFVTYRINGEMTFNRIYGNCLGWDIKNQLNTDANLNLMLALNIESNNCLLIY